MCFLEIGESLFSVGKLVGRIIVAVNLRGHAGTYMFKVYATDLNGAANGRRSVANIRITITSAVNAPPKWLRPPYTNYTISVLEVLHSTFHSFSFLLLRFFCFFVNVLFLFIINTLTTPFQF